MPATPPTSPLASVRGAAAPPVRQRVFDHERIWRLEPEAFAAAARLLAEHERPHRPTVVVAIARGGVPLGQALGRLLGVPVVTITLRHNHDDGLKVEATGCVDIVECAGLQQVASGSRVLVADDICGTGATLDVLAPLLRQHLRPAGVRTVVLCRNAASCDLQEGAGPDAWVFDTRDWVVFPWNDPAGAATEPLTAPAGVRTRQRAC
ncbi:hypothetical protein HS048_34035 [Planomonospora sp. ID91781]|uniref:phosphoribosyltransferase n=1 Tax=Planomonospora sp. ID91781 TaxID=2738135 RepID=UPI0018C3B39A|nr:phosphoribosyltransferase family protein [Planomonospora sp. ID91781]MBG0825707.1 hypothetical protein [Planomonospora sp. ID91781]